MLLFSGYLCSWDRLNEKQPKITRQSKRGNTQLTKHRQGLNPGFRGQWPTALLVRPWKCPSKLWGVVCLTVEKATDLSKLHCYVVRSKIGIEKLYRITSNNCHKQHNIHQTRIEILWGIFFRRNFFIFTISGLSPEAIWTLE